MKRPTKSADGFYHISGNKYHTLIGTRAQVWHGTAYKTAGGLTKSDLIQNKAGRIVSRAKHSTAKKEMRLVKYGYGTKKGKFGYVKLNGKSRRSRSRKMKGGYKGPSFSPADVNADTMIPNVVPQQFGPQERALVGGDPYGNAVNPEVVGKLDLGGFSGSGIAGAGITDFGAQGSVGVQERAGMAGGRRRRHRGGTADRRDLIGMDINSPQQRALLAGGKARSARRSASRTMSLGRARSARRSLALAGGIGLPPAMAK